MPAAQAKPRILIAEDELILGYVMRSQLERNGLEVVGLAANGRLAFDRCRETRPDVILMDVRMPQTDGIEATRMIMQEYPTCIIIVTAFADERTIAEARDAGAMGFLSKPVQVAAVLEEIPRALARFAEFQIVHGECPCLDDALDAFRLVEKAKALLAAGGRAIGAAAFLFIQEHAAASNLSLRAAAEAILAGG
jgi:AmiR/NasT family two-component response regulator